MKVKKDDLLAALETVRPGLANREIYVEQASSFAFLGDRVMTYNNELSLTCSIPELNVTGAVKADELYGFLVRVKKDELDVDVEDDKLKLTAGRSRVSLALERDIRLPLGEMKRKKEWKALPDPDNFVRFLKFAMGACSRSLAYPLLTCVRVDTSGVIESTDSYRVAHCRLADGLPVGTFLVPASSAKEIVKMKPQQVAEGREGWIHFRSGEVMLSCRLFGDGEAFPDLSQHLDVEKTDAVKLSFPSKIKEAMDRAWVFARRDDQLEESIDLCVKKGKLAVTAQSNTGTFEETMTMEEKDVDLKFSIIPYLLKDILNEVTEAVVFKDRLLFEKWDDAGVGWKYLTVLQA